MRFLAPRLLDRETGPIPVVGGAGAERAIDMHERLRIIAREFYARFDNWETGDWFFIRNIYADTLVAYHDNEQTHWRVDYEFMEDGEPGERCLFQEREQWTQVEMEWLPVNRAAAEDAKRQIVGSSNMRTRDEPPQAFTLNGRRVSLGDTMHAQFRPTHREVGAPGDGTGEASTFMIATDALARDGMVLDPAGGDFSAYLANPVVLWQHGRDEVRGNVPIGRCDQLTRRDENGLRGILGRVIWEVDEFARDIRGKVSRGSVNMVSVGFRILEIELQTRNIDGEDVRVPVVTQWEMTEFSVCAVGADRHALVVDRTEGGDVLSDLQRSVAQLASQFAALTVHLGLASTDAPASGARGEPSTDDEPQEPAPLSSDRSEASDEPDDGSQRAPVVVELATLKAFSREIKAGRKKQARAVLERAIGRR